MEQEAHPNHSSTFSRPYKVPLCPQQLRQPHHLKYMDEDRDMFKNYKSVKFKRNKWWAMPILKVFRYDKSRGKMTTGQPVTAMPTIPSYSILLVTRLSSSYLRKRRTTFLIVVMRSEIDNERYNILPVLVYFLAQSATVPWYTSELWHTPLASCSLLRSCTGSLACLFVCDCYLLRGSTGSPSCLFPPDSWRDPPAELFLSWCLLGSETEPSTKHIQTGTQSSPYIKEVHMKEKSPRL